jgi:hypothetical protein
MTKEQFKRKCQRVCDALGLDDPYFPDVEGEDFAPRVFEDDGTLHVVRNGMRVCFDVNNDEGSVQNERTRKVLGALNIKVTESALVKEYDQNVCPSCGHPL